MSSFNWSNHPSHQHFLVFCCAALYIFWPFAFHVCLYRLIVKFYFKKFLFPATLSARRRDWRQLRPNELLLPSITGTPTSLTPPRLSTKRQKRPPASCPKNSHRRRRSLTWTRFRMHRLRGRWRASGALTLRLYRPPSSHSSSTSLTLWAIPTGIEIIWINTGVSSCDWNVWQKINCCCLWPLFTKWQPTFQPWNSIYKILCKHKMVLVGPSFKCIHTYYIHT